MNEQRAQARTHIKAAMKSLEEARRIVANDMLQEFDSEDNHAIAMAQYHSSRAFEELDTANSRKKASKRK